MNREWWMKAPPGDCPHQQAEPVKLSSGELVACICISCFEQLPMAFIQRQKTDAMREAFCKHETRVELVELGSLDVEAMCIGCGQIERRSR